MSVKPDTRYSDARFIGATAGDMMGFSAPAREHGFHSFPRISNRTETKK